MTTAIASVRPLIASRPSSRKSIHTSLKPSSIRMRGSGLLMPPKRNSPSHGSQGAGAPAALGSSGITTSADFRNQNRNLLPPTPHNELHPTASDDTQKEGREESHRD